MTTKSNRKRKKYLKEYWKLNRERGREITKRWQQNNPERLKEYRLERELNKTHEISDEEWENCKNYFNYRCAYCNLAIEDHWHMLRGKLKNIDFSRDHVEHEGSNDLSNCVPSCKVCNSEKHTSSLSEWYNDNNPKFTYERLEKIHTWLENDYLKFKSIKYEIY